MPNQAKPLRNRRSLETARLTPALPKRPASAARWSAAKEQDMKSQEMKRLNMGLRRLRSFKPGTLPEASALASHAHAEER